jgi:exopolysaccharide biosynthesis protein
MSPRDYSGAVPYPVVQAKPRSNQETVMNEKIENLHKELRAKVDEADKQIKDLQASAKDATDKAKVEVKAQLAALDNRAKGQRAKLDAAEAKAKAWLNQKKLATSEKIAAWKAQREVSKLTAHADGAEQYAVTSMQLAVSAVDEAERAIVEAVVARMDADTAQTPPGKAA